MTEAGCTVIEPVAAEDMLAVFGLSAGIVISGLIYGLLFLLSRQHRSAWLPPAAYAAYAALVASVLLLVYVMRLDGLWQLLAVCMLIGYLLAPRAIWHLCVATHNRDKPLQDGRT